MYLFLAGMFMLNIFGREIMASMMIDMVGFCMIY